ncbi:hypothetical protein FN846DRAFT_899729 [Sphaerosporella brunnea]|uniref:Flavin-nucleotide-binding protein n=1 Tax=Sphaerosporella brunnea TaxID=1250544 RepID=A0A5J5ERM5_9PEZI|nr:hypothetical protein FN846DRAFT_899729 [Sphaerosporella brunnea]
MPRHELSYPKTAINKVNRYASLAAYDIKTVHSIIAAVPVVHVSFVSEQGLPTILPMIGALGNFANPSADVDEVQDLYIHGYVSARLFRGRETLSVCVSATIVDGLVLALTPFSHNYNYRSAILHGTASAVTDAAEKLYAMERVTSHVLPGRWTGSRIPPTKAELDSTGILKVKITAASPKIHTGGPNEPKEDLANPEVTGRVWTGVVPTWTVHGEPVARGGGRVENVPEYISQALERRNEMGKKEAVDAARVGMEGA